MSEALSPDFDDLATIFWQLGSMFSPSQLHGYLLGQLALGATLAEDEWLKQAWLLIDGVEQAREEDNEVLLRMLALNETLFTEGRLDGQLMIPDEDIELAQRVECLSFWCQGFLMGFTIAGKQKQAEQGPQQYSQEVTEALSDIAAIAQMALTDDQEEEQSEADFFDVVDYVRLAVMNIYFECLPKHESSKLTPEPGQTDTSESQAMSTTANLFTKKQLH